MFFVKVKLKYEIEERTMAPIPYKPLTEIVSSYKLILLDLWGVIVEGDKTYNGVINTINKLRDDGVNILFFSNAPRPNFTMVNYLQKWGLKKVLPNNILTSGDIARLVIKDKSIALNIKQPIIYHLGADRNDELLKNLSHTLTDDITQADIMLLSLYREGNESINEFDQLLEQAAKQPNLLILCSNPDHGIPQQGSYRYCAGYFANKVEEFGGKVIYTGKPQKVIYDKVLELYPDINLKDILMVGDTFETDILGACNAGINSALVMTGNAYKFHQAYDSIDNKLNALYNRANEIKIMPNYITSIS